MALVTKSGNRYKARFQWKNQHYCKTFDTEADAHAWCMYIRGGQGIRNRTVSAKRLGEVIRRYLDRTQTSQTELAKLTGMDHAFLNSVVTGRKETVLFDTADKILCKIDEVGQWYNGMSEEYEEAFSV